MSPSQNSSLGLCIGQIVIASTRRMLSLGNLLPGDSCLLQVYDSLCIVNPGIGDLIHNMAAAIRLCVGSNIAAQELRNLSVAIYNFVVASDINTLCVEAVLK